MYGLKHLSDLFKSAEHISFDNNTRMVLMSDCHRGDGSWADNFSKNENIYYTALTHYYKENYIYIELGDGDELWKNKNISNIINAHSDVFKLLSKFYNQGRLYFIFGNHDMIKNNKSFIKNKFSHYYDEGLKNNIWLFENIKVHEGLVLRNELTGDKIFLIHGHQADYRNSKMWRLKRFLVRYFWRPLELLGVNDPTSVSKNNKKQDEVERKLIEWVDRENNMLISGHTHRPVFPKVGGHPYFNDGSCVYPSGITAIEIEDGHIMLVKWSIKSRDDGTLFVSREIIAGPEKLNSYFKEDICVEYL